MPNACISISFPGLPPRVTFDIHTSMIQRLDRFTDTDLPGRHSTLLSEISGRR